MSEVGKGGEATSELETTLDVQEMLQQRLATPDEAIPSGEKESQKSEKELKLETLIDFYGDQVFDYPPYQGTIATVLDACPVGRMKLEIGSVESIISWIDQYKQKPAEEVEELTEDDEKVADEINDVTAEVPQREVKPEKSEALPHTKDAKKVESQKIADAPKPDVVSVDPAASTKKDEVAKVVSENREETEVYTLPVVEAEHQTFVLKDESTEDSVRQPEVNKVAVALPAVEAEPTGGGVIAANVSIEVAAESLDDALDEPDVTILDTVLDNEKPEHVDIDDGNRQVVFEVVEKFADWQELAQQETPLDEFLVTIVEEIHALESQNVEPVEMLLDEITDETLHSEVLPEFQVFLEQVQSIRESMQKLNEAKTKHECREYVDEVVVSLARLLRSFGYENPEKMIRDFLYAHPLMSLQELLDELERSMHLAIRREALRQKQVVHHKRHTSFGRLVLSVLRSLSLKQPSFDIAA